MPLLSQLVQDYDPFSASEAEAGGLDFGDTNDDERYPRSKLRVNEDVGRQVIHDVQPSVEGKSGTEFAKHLYDDAGDFAKATFSMAAFPLFNPKATAALIGDLPHTAEKLVNATAQGYKENYTPQEGESVPGMILRRFYEKPFTTLMDASALGQIAFGGAGLLTRAATAGVRGAAEGAAAAGVAGEAMAGRALGTAPEAVKLAQQAAGADRAIDLMAKATERARQIDPLSIAMDVGRPIMRRFTPDRLAEMNTVKGVTDGMAERTAVMRAAEDQRKIQLDEAFGHLNTAERSVLQPYLAGRVNFDRPVSEQLLTHTGEWVPVKGDVIRPDALEQARQSYVPIMQEYERRLGIAQDQVAEATGERAMGEARKILGDEFDPMHPEVQEYVQSEVVKAERDRVQNAMSRATGEARTSLDIAKDRAFRQQVEDSVAQNLHTSIEDAENAIPKPERTTVEEALRVMGPQGGLYFPHNAEVYNRSQSTVKNVLNKMGEAAPWKENEYSLYANGVMEHQDPVKQLLRSYATYEKNKTWLQMGYDAAEAEVTAGRAQKFTKGEWDWTSDPDVLAGTHQPFHPGKMLAEDMAEEDVQRLFTRMMEVSDDTGPMNIFDVMQGVVENAGKGPMRSLKGDIPVYKIPSSMGHGLKSIRDSLTPPTSPLARYTDNFMQYWNWANLNLRLTRIVNNVVGNSFFASLQGLHPLSVRGLSSITAMGRALGSKAGLLTDETSANLAKVFELPGIRSGGFQSEVEQLSAPLGRGGQTIAERAAGSGIPVVAAVGRWSGALERWNQNIESAYRGASLFYEMSPSGLQRTQRAFGHAADSLSLADKIASYAKAGGEVTMAVPEYREALKGVNRFFHNYDRTTPFERSTIRRIFPYYKFWKHSTELITRYPFEHPVKAALIRTMGNAAIRDTKDTMKQWGMDWDEDVPPHLQDSIPVSHAIDPASGKPVVWMYNSKGANPFSQLSGYAAEQALQMLNPMVRIAIEQNTGINLFTRERYRGALSSFTGRTVDPETGQIVESLEHPSWPEAFLRSFWPYQSVKEAVASGRVPLDTASLFDMVTKDPNQWAQLDAKGRVRRKPVPGTMMGARFLARFAGPVPVAVEMPTKEQKSARKQVVNEQLRTLIQRNPARRAEIMSAIHRTSDKARAARGR